MGVFTSVDSKEIRVRPGQKSDGPSKLPSRISLNRTSKPLHSKMHTLTSLVK